jgi:hypothetical protein
VPSVILAMNKERIFYGGAILPMAGTAYQRSCP